MRDLKEPDHLTLADGLAILEGYLPREQAKSRLRAAFVCKAFVHSPLYAFSYDEADIDWETGSVKIPRKKERFCPTFSRADFEQYFFEEAAASTAQDLELAADPTGPADSTVRVLPPSRPSEPSASPTSVATPAEEKRRELLTLKPGVWGISIDLKEAGRRLRQLWKK
jgi:hypothetical protein